MQYLLALYLDESTWPKMTPEQQQQGSAAYTAYTEALKAAGAYLGGNRLRPSATGTVSGPARSQPCARWPGRRWMRTRLSGVGFTQMRLAVGWRPMVPKCRLLFWPRMFYFAAGGAAKSPSSGARHGY